MNPAFRARSRRRTMVSIAFALVLVVAAVVFHRPLLGWFSGESMGGAGDSITMHVGTFSVTSALDPDPPALKGNTMRIQVRDTSGKPVDDATIELGYDMPAMASMPEMKGSAKVTHEKEGHYRAEFDLPMGGNWPLTMSIRSSAGSGSQGLALTVGSKGLSTSGGGMPSMAGEARSTGGAGAVDHYTCSMHPSVKQQGPGKCPICGMDLIPVTKEQQEQGVVMIDEARRQLIGVRTGEVIEGPMRDAFRAVGRVTYDEASLADVNLKVRGWITQLTVNQTGQRVASGQTLFTMYSPELYNAQQDFLLAAQGAKAPPVVPDGGSRVESLGQAARQRLRLLGMSDAQIDAIAKKGAPMESIAVPSPASGFVIEKNVVEGASVDPGMRLYRIAALDKVWGEADVYEADLAHVRVGQPAKVTLDYLPGRAYDAKVAYVYPYLESKARTGRVRVVITNKDLELRPGMYASVSLGSDVGQRVQVPAAAVVYTGPRRIVFVDLGEGRLRPQEIHVGVESGGMYEVLDGLKPGDIVATSGIFLIAAEARISTAAKYWESGPEEDAGASSMETMPAMPMPKASSAPPRSAMPSMPSMASPKPNTGAAPPSPPSSARAAPSASVAPSTVYTCPMHPEVRSPTPGKCPKCGMDLQPMGGKP